MPTQFEDELGLGPIMHRIRLWFRNHFGRLGGGLGPQDQRKLDPLTVNYAAWNAVKHHTREWPRYREAPNLVEVYVSLEDWEEYWGIDAERKESSVAAYVQAQAARRKLWMAGTPQVQVFVDEAIEAGDVDVVCRFVEPEDEDVVEPVSHTSSFEAQPEDGAHMSVERTSLLNREGAVASTDANGAEASGEAATAHEGAGAHAGKRPAGARPQKEEAAAVLEVPPTERYMSAARPGEAKLVGEGNFCLVISSGDCIGAVREGEEVPDEVNVRLDAQGFPYVNVKQCTLKLIGGTWHIINHAAHGTRLLLRDGTRLMLGQEDPYPLSEGDIIYLGPTRPLRFELG